MQEDGSRLMSGSDVCLELSTSGDATGQKVGELPRLAEYTRRSILEKLKADGVKFEEARAL